MMKNYKPLAHVLLVVIAASCLHPVRARKKMCSKILFKNINEQDMPWIQVEGIYKLSSTNDGFPVYSNAVKSLVLYYSYDTARGIKSLVIGKKIGNVFGLIGLLPADFDPETWLASGYVDKNDVFGDAVTSWKYYFPLENTFKDVSRKPKAVCVDDDVFECSSGKVFLNELITGQGSSVLNDPKSDFFDNLQGVYSGVRSVFKHSRQNWYLYYRNYYWRIGTSYNAASTNDILRVQDVALKPEFMTERWEKWTGTHWAPIEDDLRVLCRGIANGENKCQGQLTCKNKASCVYTKANETLCVCPSSAYGPHCEQTTRCSNPVVPTSAVSVSWTGTRPGDIATLFCTAGYRSLPMEFYICEGAGGQAKEWYLESKASCQVQRPTFTPETTISSTSRVYPTRTQTTKKPWDKSLDFLIFFGPCLAFQILVPVFIWLGLTIAGLFRTCRTTQAGTDERFEAVGKVQAGKYRRLFRVYSAFLNFAFWAWLGFVCTCVATDLHEVHEYLFYCAIGMVFFCAVFVIIEAFTCPERIALQNIVSWEYIEHFHTVPPVIEMEVERYNEITVQEGGLHTNPRTGYREYRHEIRRKVGRKIIREPFVFSSWTDTSDRENSFGQDLTRVRLNVVITLEGETTRQSFEAQKESLIQKTEHLNRFYTFSRKDKVPDMQPFVTLCCHRESVPSWMKEDYFWYATFLQLSWLYRWAFNCNTKSAEYTFSKKVFDVDDCGTRSTDDEHKEEGNSIQANEYIPTGDEKLVQFPHQTSENACLIDDAADQHQKNYMTI